MNTIFVAEKENKPILFFFSSISAPVARVTATDAAEGNGDLPRVEDGFGAIPDALSTDSEVVKR